MLKDTMISFKETAICIIYQIFLSVFFQKHYVLSWQCFMSKKTKNNKNNCWMSFVFIYCRCSFSYRSCYKRVMFCYFNRNISLLHIQTKKVSTIMNLQNILFQSEQRINIKQSDWRTEKKWLPLNNMMCCLDIVYIWNCIVLLRLRRAEKVRRFA